VRTMKSVRAVKSVRAMKSIGAMKSVRAVKRNLTKISSSIYSLLFQKINSNF